jgi:hypothetical protein
VLLRDCTTAIEGHDTIGTLAGTSQAIRELEMADLASTTTSAAFVAACEAAGLTESETGSEAESEKVGAVAPERTRA